MKPYAILLLLAIVAGCGQGVRPRFADIPTEGMPSNNGRSQLIFEQNVRNCRSQPTCNAADLFER